MVVQKAAMKVGSTADLKADSWVDQKDGYSVDHWACCWVAKKGMVYSWAGLSVGQTVDHSAEK
eukprot:scaffold5409_cov119-Ochromonas_danica.AAC.1